MIGQWTDVETKIEVLSQVRELVTISIDNIEKALALFFDAAKKSSSVKNFQAIERDSVFLFRGVLGLQAFGLWWPKSLQFCC